MVWDDVAVYLHIVIFRSLTEQSIWLYGFSFLNDPIRIIGKVANRSNEGAGQWSLSNLAIKFGRNNFEQLPRLDALDVVGC